MSSTFTRILTLGESLAVPAKAAFPGAAVESFAASAASGLEAAAARADLVLIAADGGGELLEAAIHRLGRAQPQPAVILAGSSLPFALVRALMKLDRSDVLETPFRAEDLARTAEPLLRPKEARASCLCWGVIGAVGGAGATTVVVEAAAALAARQRQQRGCIIDLNLADGATAAYLGVPANMRLDEATATPERIDQALLDAFCTPAMPGVDLLAAPRSPQAFDAVTPQAVMRILEVAADKYDWILLDMPRHRRAWTLDVLSGCDEILVISELTVPALLAARDLCRELEGELPDHTPASVVLNRMSPRMMGPAPSLSEAQRALNRKAIASVTSDWESAAKAVNLGGPILHRQPRSKIARDVRVLVAHLLGRKVGEADGGMKIAG